MRPPSKLELAFVMAVYGWDQARGAVRGALYRVGLRGCPACTLRRGHKMDCRRIR